MRTGAALAWVLKASHALASVNRRAERHIIPLVERGDVATTVLVYMNRLSDFFFVAARYAAFKQGRQEVTYQKSKSAAIIAN